MKQRIGAVSYLNTIPLVRGLDQLAPDYQLVFDLPSRLAERLARGELDVALIPVVEALDGRRWTTVSDACIACRGPVWSVKILSRVPLAQIQSLALDEGSRTSVVLARILLAEQFGLSPTLMPLRIDEDYRAVAADAVLLIGDRAMRAVSNDFHYHLDLGQAWRDWTGLPFVFAVWAAAQDADIVTLGLVLGRARDLGLSQAQAIAQECAARYELSEGQIYRYLTEHLHYTLSDAERRGLELFLTKAAAQGLLPAGSALPFFECEAV